MSRKLFPYLLFLFYFLLSVQCCPGQNGTWNSNLSFFPSNVFGHLSIEESGRIYIIGGYILDNTSIENSRLQGESLCYNTNTNRWEKGLSKLPRDCGYASGFIKQNIIYVIGGFGDPVESFISKSTYICNTSTNEWSLYGHTLNTNRYGSTVSTVGDSVYIIGGAKDVSTVLNSIEKCYPSQSQWMQEEKLPFPLCFSSSLTIGESIYLFGGASDLYEKPLKKTLKFNTTQKAWDLSIPDLPIGVSTHAVVELNGFVYIFGGKLSPIRSNKEAIISDAVMMFDPKEEYWQIIDHMPAGLFGLSIHKIGDNFFLVGGLTSEAINSKSPTDQLLAISVYNPVSSPIYSKSTKLEKCVLMSPKDSCLIQAEMINHFDYKPTVIARLSGEVSKEMLEEELYDDGSHGDKIALDGTYSNYLYHPGVEDLFEISIVSKNKELAEQFISGQDTRALSTIGPLQVSQYKITKQRKHTDEGIRILLNIEIMNKGSVALAPNLSIDLFSTDDLVKIEEAHSGCVSLKPLQSTRCNNSFQILISNAAKKIKSFNVHVSISSNGLSYWNEVLEIEL